MTPGDPARVADIRARADAATDEDLDPGPLADDLDHLDALRAVAVAHAANPDDDGSIMDYWAELHRFDTTLLRAARVAIATATAARADVPWLLDRLAAETERADVAEAAIRQWRSLPAHQRLYGLDLLEIIGETDVDGDDRG